jgi:hypothetical protein
MKFLVFGPNRENTSEPVEREKDLKVYPSPSIFVEKKQITASSY